MNSTAPWALLVGNGAYSLPPSYSKVVFRRFVTLGSS